MTKAKSPKAKLPSKLSDLLDLAVTDAQKVLRRKKFKAAKILREAGL